MKTRNKISGYIIRSAAYAAFLSFTFIALSSALNSPNRWHKSIEGKTMTLTVALTGTGETAGTFTLKFGEQAELYRCA